MRGQSVGVLMSNLSPNMKLPISTVGVDSGLAWEQNLNSALTILDSHNHTSGSGVQIPPGGLNINANLPFQGNFATGVGGITFTPQLSAPSALNSLYVDGVDLYFLDGNDDSPIQITSGGAVNATSSGIASGTATAAFVSSVLVVNAASNTPANIQAASILMGNNSAGSKYLTLAPPAAMAADYGLVLPALPASAISILQLDTAGNITVSAGVTGSQIAATTIAAGNMVPNTLTASQISLTAGITNQQLAAANIGAASSSGNGYSNATTGFTTVTNQSITFTSVSGRPVFIGVRPVAGQTGYFEVIGGAGQTAAGIAIQIYNSTASASVYNSEFGGFFNTAIVPTFIMPPGMVYTIVTPTANVATTCILQVAATNATMTVYAPYIQLFYLSL